MDSDEDMRQIDSELPSLSLLNKGKGKADESADPTAGKDDTLPWYVNFSCDEILD